MNFLKVVALLAVTAVAGMACWVLYDLHVAIVATTQRTDALLTDTRRVILSMGGISANLREATDEAKKASKVQAAYWNQAAAQTNKDLQDFDSALVQLQSVLRHTDAAIGHLDTELGATAAQVNASVKQVGDTMASLQPGIAALTQTAENAAKLTSDPALLASLDHLNKTSANIERVTTDFAGMMHDDLRPAVHRAVQPASKARLAYFLISQTFPLLARAIP